MADLFTPDEMTTLEDEIDRQLRVLVTLDYRPWFGPKHPPKPFLRANVRRAIEHATRRRRHDLPKDIDVK